MTITDFLYQAHPATLDWIENDLMDKLIAMDKAQKRFSGVQEFRQAMHEHQRWNN